MVQVHLSPDAKRCISPFWSFEIPPCLGPSRGQYSHLVHPTVPSFVVSVILWSPKLGLIRYEQEK